MKESRPPAGRSSDSAGATGRNLKVCQVILRLDTQSETFLRAHREWLPFTVRPVGIESWDKPVLRSETGWLFPKTSIARGARKFSHEVVRNFLNRRFSRAFSRFLLRERFDCVLAEYGPVGVTVSEACAARNIPLVVHFHGFDAHLRNVVEELADAYKRLFEIAAAVIVVSRAMREKLISLGCPPNRIHLIPCGVDLAGFEQRPAPSARREDAFHFFFVGRFVNKKGPIHLLLAFQQCLARVDARLTMAGDGPLLDATREIAGALGLADKVDFPGRVSHQRVKRLLAETDCYVQHSIEALSGDAEGSPVSIVEAGAAGLPVISTRHAGIVDSVINGETGFLVEEGEVIEMGERMARLAADRELCQRLGEAGRRHVRKNYASDLVTAKLARVIRECCTR